MKILCRIYILLLLSVVGAFAQYQPGGPCAGTTNSATSGQVLSAGATQRTPPCTWVAASSGSVTSVIANCGLRGGGSTTAPLSVDGPCWAAGGGTAQAQTATFTTAITLTLVDGLEVCWKPSNANSGAAPTFAPNGLTAHTIVKAGGAALVASDLITTQQACAIYNSTGTQWELQNPATGGGAPVTLTQHLDYSVSCQNTLSGSPFGEPVTAGATHSCDSAWSNMDGYESFTTGTTNYAISPQIQTGTTFADPVSVTLWWNTTATSGTFIPGLSALCVSTGGAITTNWWTGATYTAFASSTASGTASRQTKTTTLSFTSGCTVGQVMYLALRWRGGSGTDGTLAANAQIKLMDVVVLQ